jgi:ubiquitin-conjugating enzyme E2 D/E
MLEKDPLDYCRNITLIGDDIFNWECEIIGPDNSPYAGGKFILKLEFPTQYPFKAPKLKFSTKVYHPSVQTETGDVCGDVLGNWGPTLNAKHCLQVVYSMLQSPESDHPLEESIAQMLRDNPKEFAKTAKKFTKDYAK